MHGERRHLALAILATAVAQAAFVLAAVYTEVRETQPVKGDCLSGLTKEAGDWPIVDCDDPSAAYQVVETGNGGIGREVGTCDEHPDGQAIGGHDRGTQWEVCVVPGVG